jgi:hypothetical protein
MLIRFVILAAVIAVLALAGLIDLGGLPWESNDFRASGVTVLLYLFWSLTESRGGIDGMDPSRLAMYTVLLVSAVDSFLLRITVWEGLYILRFAGVAIFAAGSILRLTSGSSGRPGMLRAGRILQLVGLPAGLGSVAGVLVGAVPGTVAALREDQPEAESR